MTGKPVAVYTVRFMDLLKAWSKMGVNETYVILNFGLFLEPLTSIYGEHPLFRYNEGKGSFNDAEILEIRSPLLYLVIISRDSLPYVEYTDLCDAERQGLKPIEGSPHLYSNINGLNANGDTLRVVRSMNLVHSKETKFILIKVRHTSDSSTYDFDQLEDINAMLGAVQ